MAQNISSFNTEKKFDTPPPKYRPIHFSTFQNRCINPNANVQKSTLPIAKSIQDDAKRIVNVVNEHLIVNLHELTHFTATVPYPFLDNKSQPEIIKCLIDQNMLSLFYQEKLINWNRKLLTLYPIQTSANGNCLLHAVLIAMIGVHDFDLYLRDRLLQFIDENKQILQNYWRMARLQSDQTHGIAVDERKLEREWTEVCDLVRYENAQDGRAPTRLKYLEAIHIFSLSNLLRRPIIVLAEHFVRNLDDEEISVNDLYGIYLPVLLHPKDCFREPIVLAYDQYHFSPLLTYSCHEQYRHENRLPLYPSKTHVLEQILLPIRFTNLDGQNFEDPKDLLSRYLQLHWVSYQFDGNPMTIQILCADLGTGRIDQRHDFLLLYHRYCKDFFDVQLPNTLENERREAEKQRSLSEFIVNPIRHDTRGRSIVGRAYTPSPEQSPREDHQIPSNQDSRTILTNVDQNVKTTSVPIPIHFLDSTRKETSRKTLPPENELHIYDTCLLCNRVLEDPDSTYYCSKCDLDMRSGFRRETPRSVPSRASSQSAYSFREPVSARSKPPRTRMTCSHCNAVNMNLASIAWNMDFNCSSCGKTLYSNRPSS